MASGDKQREERLLVARLHRSHERLEQADLHRFGDIGALPISAYALAGAVHHRRHAASLRSITVSRTRRFWTAVSEGQTTRGNGMVVGGGRSP
jgi:hypothetical protein